MPIQHLYKYGRINRQCEERAEKLFSTPALWFSAPAELNDPFECRPWITGEGTKDQVMGYLIQLFRKNCPCISEEAIISQAKACYLEGRYRCPETWEGFRQALIDSMNQSIGVFCLTEANDEILMWSHYADEHRGYCLMFEASNTTPTFGTAQKVIYSGDLPSIDIFNDTPFEKSDKAMLTKYCGWSYEQEWRIVDHEFGAGSRDYPTELLVGVIFGARMPSSDRARIRGWLRQRKHPVSFYEAVQSERQFKVDIRPLV